MLRLLQIISLLNKEQRKHFIALFDDLSFELEEMGYSDDPEMLIEELLENHFGIEFECSKQLTEFTNAVLKYQGKIGNLSIFVKSEEVQEVPCF